MKTLPFFILAIFMLGCEEIVYKDVIKYVDRPVPGPTSFVAVTETKECESTDTLKIEVEMQDIWENGEFKKDTTLSLTTACHATIRIRGYVLIPRDTVVRDSIVHEVVPTEYIDRQVTVYDTVWQTKVEQRIINQVQYIFPGNSVTYIPTDLQEYVNDFYALAAANNKLIPGGDLVITYVPAADLPGENWVSNFYYMAGDQGVLELSEELIAEHSRSPIYRELGRMQLKKKYTNVPDRIMNPLFPVTTTLTTNHVNILFQ